LNAATDLTSTISEGADDSAPILVTGGTGTLGRHVVANLLERGRSVRVLGRRLPDGAHATAGVEYVAADLGTGEGVDAALEGALIVIHLAGSAKGDDVKARNLVRAAQRADTRHLVFISVVGGATLPVRTWLDRAMFGYFAAKGDAERIVAESGIPWTTLRATQFHELTLKTVEAMAKLPIVPVPSGWQFQPIAASEVADRLADLALDAPAGLVEPMGGPRVETMADLTRAYLRATGRERPIVQVPTPGGAARAFRSGANLVPARSVGRQAWDEFLVERFGQAATNAPVASDSEAA
jgi:uncharacterized protein YbjT (DUF2867 family)